MGRPPPTTARRRSWPTTAAAEFGVDAKWGITQSIVTDFTYNTDFAQVEDDEAQVNLTRFSVLFPEKRDFFLEGQDVFNFAGAGANQGGAQQGPTAVPMTGGGPGGNNVTPIVFFSRRIGLQNGAVIPILAGGAPARPRQRVPGGRDSHAHRGDAVRKGASHGLLRAARQSGHPQAQPRRPDCDAAGARRIRR